MRAPKAASGLYQASLRRCRPSRQRKLRCGTWRLGRIRNCPAGGRRGLNPRPSAATAQSRLLSKLDVSGDHHPDGHMPVDRVVLGVQRAAAGVEADLAAEVACQLAGGCLPPSARTRRGGRSRSGVAWRSRPSSGSRSSPQLARSAPLPNRRAATCRCRRIPVPPPSDGWRGRSVPPCSGTWRPPGASPASCWREDAAGAWRSGTPGSSGWSGRRRHSGGRDGVLQPGCRAGRHAVAGLLGPIPSSSWTGTCCR
jgi:hypothetical protein